MGAERYTALFDMQVFSGKTLISDSADKEWGRTHTSKEE